MFPSVRTRTRAAFLRAVDRAIEFATLGEYGLEVPAADGPALGHGWGAQRAARRPGPAASPRRLPRRVQAATPAGRRAAAGVPDRGIGPRFAVPGGVAPSTGVAVRPHVPHPLFRQRGGQVAARPQVCVVNAPAG
jgi:hypothetical protein